ncbi:MAG TPA: hypothetical protein VMW56_17260 [Candidatus Margulisiibacteriota bacterium]|nr:hypothetical protein [Candidatus Margulisiibacteriota bacterium]
MATFVTPLGSGGVMDPGVGHIADPASVASGCESQTARTLRLAPPSLGPEPPPHPHSAPALATNSAKANRIRGGRHCGIRLQKLIRLATPLADERWLVAHSHRHLPPGP